jgi:hypothetical protein
MRNGSGDANTTKARCSAGDPNVLLPFIVALVVCAQAAVRAQTPAPAITPAPLPSRSSSPAPSASPSAFPTTALVPENSLVTARVRREFDAWQRDRIDRKTYSPTAGGIYSDAVVAIVEPDLAAIGPLQTIDYHSTSLLLGDLVYRYDISGSAGVVSVLYSLDDRGRTDGIVFTPQVFRATGNVSTP